MKKATNRYEKIKKLREDGWKFREIAEKFKVSRQLINYIFIHRVVPAIPIRHKCFKCKRIFFRKDRGPRARVYSFCRDCFSKYFTRLSGTELTGLDYTREIARIRDKHTCQKCGKKWKLGQRRFDIHHLYECGEKSHNYDKSIIDLITICHKCHLNLDQVRYAMSTKSSPRPIRNKIYQEEWRRMAKNKQTLVEI